MKKLMFAAALAASMAATAADVESGIVGYTQTDIVKDGRLTVSGVPFVNSETGGNINITEVVPTIDGEIPGDGAFILTWYNRSTGGYTSAGWCEGTYPTYADMEADINFSDSAAWGNGDYIAITDKTFTAGEWALVQPTVDGNSQLTVAGKLVTSDSTSPVNSVTIIKDGRLTAVGNPIPAVTDIQEITATIDDEVAGDGAFILTWYDRSTGGYTSAGWCEGTYPTYADMEADTNFSDSAAWGDGDYVIINKQFEIGEGFLVQPTVDGTSKLLFVNPFYKE